MEKKLKKYFISIFSLIILLFLILETMVYIGFSGIRDTSVESANFMRFSKQAIEVDNENNNPISIEQLNRNMLLTRLNVFSSLNNNEWDSSFVNAYIEGDYYDVLQIAEELLEVDEGKHLLTAISISSHCFSSKQVYGDYRESLSFEQESYAESNMDALEANKIMKLLAKEKNRNSKIDKSCEMLRSNMTGEKIVLSYLGVKLGIKSITTELIKSSLQSTFDEAHDNSARWSYSDEEIKNELKSDDEDLVVKAINKMTDLIEDDNSKIKVFRSCTYSEKCKRLLGEQKLLNYTKMGARRGDEYLMQKLLEELQGEQNKVKRFTWLLIKKGLNNKGQYGDYVHTAISNHKELERTKSKLYPEEEQQACHSVQLKIGYPVC